eukprot:c52161_g1_i1.p1 GENE.c52161_g1_i1~~c52161_g1_i1.p1  ORF type:complete len:444 (-),score=92.20 c52161_g1_i1:58-1389(-)
MGGIFEVMMQKFGFAFLVVSLAFAQQAVILSAGPVADNESKVVEPKVETVQPTETPEPRTESPQPTPETTETPQPTPEPKIETPQPTPETISETPQPTPETATQTPQPTAEPTVAPQPTPEPMETPEPQAQTPEVAVESQAPTESEEAHKPSVDLSGPFQFDLNEEDDDEPEFTSSSASQNRVPPPPALPTPERFSPFQFPIRQPNPQFRPNFLSIIPEILKDIVSNTQDQKPAEIQIEFPTGPFPGLIGGLANPFHPHHRHNFFHPHLPMFMSPIHSAPFAFHPSGLFHPLRQPFHMFPLHMPNLMAFPPRPKEMLHELPVHLQHLISEGHTTIPNDRQPMIMKMEQRNGFYVITGWFPGVSKEDLSISLHGASLVVTGKISDQSETVRDQLAEFGDVDEVNETMELPYAPDNHLFKAHFDEEKHTLTAVFPVQSPVNIQLD